MFSRSPKLNKTVESIWRLEKLILNSLDFNHVVQEIVDGVLHELGYLELGYEIVVLCLVDKRSNTLNRVSISKTTKAKEALYKSPIPFKEIKIPLTYNDNKLIKAYSLGKKYIVYKWDEILSPAFSASEALQIQDTLGIKASLVYPVISQNEPLGTLIFSMSKSPKKVSAQENELIETFSDIVGLAVQNASLYSQVHERNQDLRKANKHLRELDKLKDEFVYIATHELKTPVTVIKGYTSMIKDGNYGDMPESLKEPLKEIESASQQLQLLVNDLLDIARAESTTLAVKTEPTDLSQVVEETLSNVRTLAEEKGLKLDYEPMSRDMVMADANRLKEVLNNLISNAIKYSTEGTIAIYHTNDKGQLVTHVRDQGHGIAQEDHHKVFGRFFRAEDVASVAPGTGLGLFIVKQLVEKMGGRIWFSSKLGSGSTFSFSLKKG